MGPVDIVRGLDGPLRTVGVGLVMAYIGFGFDFYVHEVAKSAADAESIWSPAHVPIFIGMGIVGLGFLWALRRVRIAVGPTLA